MDFSHTTRALGEKLKSAFESRLAEPVPAEIQALAEALDRALERAPPCGDESDDLRSA